MGTDDLHDPAMTRRELQQWVTNHGVELMGRGVRAEFGFGAAIDGNDATWVSFNSASGSGRLVRSLDGSTAVSVYSHGDGLCLTSEVHGVAGSEAQLSAVVDELAVRRSPGMA